MFCYKCGGPVDDSQAYCPTCGAPSNTAARGENVSQSLETVAQSQMQSNMVYPDYNQLYYGAGQQPVDYSNHGMILNGVNVSKKKKCCSVAVLQFKYTKRTVPFVYLRRGGEVQRGAVQGHHREVLGTVQRRQGAG